MLGLWLSTSASYLFLGALVRILVCAISTRFFLNECLIVLSGPGNVVSIATSYRLDDPGIESRWGVRFSVPVQTGPGAHPASCTMGTGSFPGVKSGRGVTLAPHPLLVP